MKIEFKFNKSYEVKTNHNNMLISDWLKTFGHEKYISAEDLRIKHHLLRHDQANEILCIINSDNIKLDTTLILELINRYGYMTIKDAAEAGILTQERLHTGFMMRAPKDFGFFNYLFLFIK